MPRGQTMQRLCWVHQMHQFPVNASRMHSFAKSSQRALCWATIFICELVGLKQCIWRHVPDELVDRRIQPLDKQVLCFYCSCHQKQHCMLRVGQNLVKHDVSGATVIEECLQMTIS